MLKLDGLFLFEHRWASRHRYESDLLGLTPHSAQLRPPKNGRPQTPASPHGLRSKAQSRPGSGLVCGMPWHRPPVNLRNINRNQNVTTNQRELPVLFPAWPDSNWKNKSLPSMVHSAYPYRQAQRNSKPKFTERFNQSHSRICWSRKLPHASNSLRPIA